MLRKSAVPMLILLLAATAGARELTSAYVVPSAANTKGKYGTDWHTDLSLYNPHGYSLPIVLHFLPNGTDNGGPVPTVTFELYAWETLNLWDVLGPDVFAARGRIGALLVYVDDALIACAGTDCDFAVFSRTYTLDPLGGVGEYGQGVPGFPAHLGLDSSVIAYLPQLIEGDGFRTNLGLASWTDGWVTVRVDIQAADGTIIDRRDHLVPPFGHVQWPMDRKVTGGTAAMYVVGGPASTMVYPYASVANNASGDAVTVEANLTPAGLTAQAAEPRAVRQTPEIRPDRSRVTGFDADVLRANARRP